MPKRDKSYYETVQKSADELSEAIDMLIAVGQVIDDEQWVKDRHKVLDMMNKMNVAIKVTSRLYSELGMETLSNDDHGPGGIRFRD